MKTSIAFIHASPTAIAPLTSYYSREAPEYEITNLLDDGLLRSFAAGDTARAEQQIGRMIATARDEYGSTVAFVTCSALPLASIPRLADAVGIPVVKIDEEMARRATACGPRVGVAITFEPTIGPTRNLLLEAASLAGRQVELQIGVYPEAHRALLDGNPVEHDRLLLAGIQELDRAGVDCIVLAQVSMARVLEQARSMCRAPIYTSLETSLDTIRRIPSRDRGGAE